MTKKHFIEIKQGKVGSKYGSYRKIELDCVNEADDVYGRLDKILDDEENYLKDCEETE